MKFERVDEKTVRCFISNEELEDYQIDYKDFVLRSDKAKEVVRDIITQASEEVGYKPPKFAFDMSIMMLPDQGLVLTFSESDPLEGNNGERLMQYLKEMKKAFDKSLEDKNKDPEDIDDRKQEKKPKELKELPQPEMGIFEFPKLGDVMELACVIPANLRVHSELYRMEDKYYLYVHKGAAAYQRYSRLCVQAMEFGGIYGATDQKYLYLQEHGECLIAEHALRKLRFDKGDARKTRKKA